MFLSVSRYIYVAVTSVLFVGGLVVTPLYAEERPLIASESIASFRTDIEVHEDATIHVVETIVYNFDEFERHGIIRDIPLTNGVGTVARLEVTNVSVKNERGQPVSFEVTGDGTRPVWSKLFDGSILFGPEWLSVRIGDPYETVTGLQTYIISYDAHNALGYFDDRTEIYWNTTGHFWEVPILSAETYVHLPQNVRAVPTMVRSYCGEIRSTSACIESTTISSTEVAFYSKESLSVGEGMTVAVGFPKESVSYPSQGDRIFRIVALYWGWVGTVLVTVWLQRKRFMQVRKVLAYRSGHTIVAEYDAGSVTPLEASAILKGRVTSTAMSAQIIQLATRGYLTIKKNADGEYSFNKTDKTDGLLKLDKRLLQTLSGKTTKQLENSFFTTFSDLQKETMTSLRERGYISEENTDPEKTIAFFVITVILVFGPGAMVGGFLGTQAGILFTGSLVASAVIRLLLLFIKGLHLTESGLGVEHSLQGLRHYIDVAEDERIAFHNAPEKNPELFEKLLPFAMIFSLEEKWAKEFADIYTVAPEWYSGATGDTFTSVGLSHSLQQFTSHASHSLFTNPYSGGSSGSSRSSGSSFGSSGSSSGSSSGFSGGGGGGGGGRSW